MRKYFDFKLHKVDLLPLCVLVLSVAWVLIFRIDEILENTIYENIAVIPLLAGVFFCLRAKNHKVFFKVIAMILFLAFAREFNYGRVPFCALPDDPHNFYSWSHYKYGWLAHVFVGLYIALGAIYALVNKIWVDIVQIVKKVALPIWDFLCVFILIALQMYCEKVLDYTVAEEIAEFTIYAFTFAIVWIYYKKLN